MKNYDEFRRTVFEKADRYKAKRKARNKKIIETVSLCSLCLIIGISAYFALDRGYFVPESVDSAPTTPATGTPQAVQTTLADSPIETAGTTTGAYMTTTTMVTTTYAYTTSTTTVEATFTPTTEQTSSVEATFSDASSSAAPMIPQNKNYILQDIVPCTDENALPSLFVAKEYPALKDALARDFSQNIPKNERENLQNIYDEAFFEQNVLLILHVSDAYPYTVSFEDGHFVYTVEKGDMTSEDKQMFLIISIKKDKFLSATMEGDIS